MCVAKATKIKARLTYPHAHMPLIMSSSFCGCRLLFRLTNIPVDILVVPLQDGLDLARQDIYLCVTRQDDLVLTRQNG